jgi:hypothetical protein
MAGYGIDVDALAERLQRHGASAFSANWASLLEAIGEKAAHISGATARRVEPRLIDDSPGDATAAP